MAIGIAIAASLAGCAAKSEPFVLADPDGARFAEEVYPVLLRDCALAECHGAPHRFFRVFGPGRTRLLRGTDLLAPATAAEILDSYDRTRSMLEPAPRVQNSLLLRKPLAAAAGGISHEGSDAYGRNVYATRSAPGYVTLAEWATGKPAPEAPGAISTDAGP